MTLPARHAVTWLPRSPLVQVSFVIPVYNQLAHTQACLASLREHLPSHLSHEIILVDDGSDPETKAFLASLDTPHRVITQSSNRGYAHATNAGAHAATGQWLCLLNNDVEITAGAIEAMLAVRESHPNAGIIGNIQITTATGEVDHAGIEFRDGGYPRHRRAALSSVQAEGEVVSAVAVTAACCLVDRTWFIAMGGFDTRYRNGFEDVDLCLRARENGWGIYVATRSVVRHAVSTSEGRGRHEFRNAKHFLARWGPRAAAIEISEGKRAAALTREARARTALALAAPPAVRAARQAEIEAADRRHTLAQQPVTVWVDLLRMEPGGANGGIKPFVYAFLRELTTLSWQPQRYVLLIQDRLAPEIDFVRPTDLIAAKHANGWMLNNEPEAVSLAELERRAPPEVLYSPFGTSSFARPDLPNVALLVDALHRDLPAALPIEEVNFREDNFKRVIASATWVQTLATHGIERLQLHYGLHPSRCFHTHAPVHRRFIAPDPLPTPPPGLPTENYFFYPANFWPHKNHEVLLTAYRLYRQRIGSERAWSLLLTGFPDQRQQSLRELTKALRLNEWVHFAGHVSDDVFVGFWKRAGALVFPSLHEGFGIPLLEAFEQHLPVVASDHSALPEVGGDACHWFDPTSPSALADALTVISRDSDLRARLVAAGTRRLQHFSLHFEASRLNHFLHAAARGLVP